MCPAVHMVCTGLTGLYNLVFFQMHPTFEDTSNPPADVLGGAAEGEEPRNSIGVPGAVDGHSVPDAGDDPLEYEEWPVNSIDEDVLVEDADDTAMYEEIDENNEMIEYL